MGKPVISDIVELPDFPVDPKPICWVAELNKLVEFCEDFNEIPDVFTEDLLEVLEPKSNTAALDFVCFVDFVV